MLIMNFLAFLAVLLQQSTHKHQELFQVIVGSKPALICVFLLLESLFALTFT